MLSLGSTIKQLRMAAGLSQRTLAKRLAVTPSYLSHLEAGRREPSVQLVRKLANALSVPAGLILAVLVWSDLDEIERAAYQPIVSKLIDAGTAARFNMID